MKFLIVLNVLICCLGFGAAGCHSLGHEARSTVTAGPNQAKISNSMADTGTDPASIVGTFYRGHSAIWPADAEHRSPLLSEHLSLAIAVSQRTFGQFFLMFDPIVNGQDALIDGLIVHPALFDDDRAYVNVRFRNFDQDNALVYSFVNEKGSWKLDELASIGGETRWLLTDILRNP